MASRQIPQPDNRVSLLALKQIIKHRSPLFALKVFHEHLGDIFRLSLPGLNTVMLVGPKANRFILVEAKDKFVWRTETDPVTLLLREGVLVTDGEAHDTMRRNMNQPLHRQSLSNYVDAMVHFTDYVINEWDNANPIDMLIEMRKITLMILTETLFKVDIAPEINAMWQPIMKSIDYISPGLWILWPSSPRFGYKKHINRMNDYLFQIIQYRRNQADIHEADDLLGQLIALGLDDNLIRDQLLTMLIAGHDTSTALLAWALHMLVENPDVMEKAKAEVDTLLGEDISPSIDNIGQFTYLGQVVDETLRLYPPIHLGSRRVIEDMEFDNYILPAGMRIMYSIFLTHRDPKHWDNPDEFDPERFAPAQKRQITPYSYLPFGGGQRNCIGTAFALLEAKVVLARILQKFDLHATGQKIGLKMSATLEPHPGVLLKVTRRS